jgi:hypothetical protein
VPLSPALAFLVSNLKSMAYLLLILDLFAVLLFLAAIRAIRDCRRRAGLPYPPGPRSLPIIGNILDIPLEYSWLKYSQFSQTYGHALSLPEVLFTDRDNREYCVFLRFGAGYGRIEQCRSSQGTP